MTNVSTKTLFAPITAHQALRLRFRYFFSSSNEIILGLKSYFTVVSKMCRRHVSSVPGPMESRRRLGKRKMVYVFEPFPKSNIEKSSWWRYFQENDVTICKWEPARPHISIDRCKIDASQYFTTKWLLSFFKNLGKDTASLNKSEPECSGDVLLRKQLTNMHAISREGSKDMIAKACRNFNQTLGKCLLNTALSDREIVCIINEVSQLLSETKMPASSFYSFYETVWIGIQTVKLRTCVLNEFEISISILKWLSKLPINLQGQYLVASIVESFSGRNDVDGLFELLRGIFTSWALNLHEDLQDFSTKQNKYSYKNHFTTAEKIVKANSLEVLSINNKILIGKSIYDISILLRELRLKILSGLKAIEGAESFLTPKKLSGSNLARTLQLLPQGMMKELISECSKNLSEIFQGNEIERNQSAKNFWLASISQISTFSSKEFLSLLKYMDTHCLHLETSFHPEVLINRWKNYCSPEVQALVENIMQITSLYPQKSYGPWVSLISIIYKYYPTELHFKFISTIFRTLYELDKVETLGNTILHMSGINPRLPAEILEFAVEKVVDHNPDMAWKIVILSRIMKPGYKYRSMRFPRGDFRTIRYPQCPKFVNWMITDSELNPWYIWKIICVRVHTWYTPRYRNQPSSELLHPQVEAFFKNMATAFAYSKRLSQRVAFRNVMRCWHQLRHHKTHVDIVIVRALIHSGITRCIENGVWVPENRKLWLLHLLAQVESAEAVSRVDQILKAWNKQITSKKAWLHRESNVLRVGQID